MAPLASKEAAPSAKQLVFLFMASTVVAVVVFLCGVLVGRGVPARRATHGPSFGELGSALPVDEAERRLPFRDLASGGPSAGARSGDDLSYSRRLGSSEPFPETLQAEGADEIQAVSEPARDTSDASPRPTPNEAVAVLPAHRELAPEPETRPRVSSAPDDAAQADATIQVASTPAAQGWTVQVAALRGSEAAQQVADRLLARGFPAYVLDPAPDAPVAVYRVRVGRYVDYGEAERIHQRLEQEEQFKPWITR